jgi:hypothetical protein
MTRTEEVESALRRLDRTLADRLSGPGWVGRDLGRHTVATLTRAGDDGVLLVVEILRVSFSLPARWPVDVAARMGVGNGQALDLMPLLTLPVRPILVDDESDEDRGLLPVSLAGPRDVVPAAERIAAWVEERSAVLRTRFPDMAAVEAELERQNPAEPPADDDVRSWSEDLQQRLVLLAALGRRDEARALLATYEAGLGSADPRTGSAARRFARQLSRRLDPDAPPAPPAEETLDLVQPELRGPVPSRAGVWAAARAKQKTEKEAMRAAAARSAGADLQQLTGLVATEHRARGVELSPSEAAYKATLLRMRRRPFGPVRSTVAGYRTAAVLVRDFVRTVRGRLPADPDWLRPPERAGYRVTGGSHTLPVQLDASVRDWLERIRAEAPRRYGPITIIDAWLTRQPGGGLTVHIGQRRVGTVHPGDARRLEPAMTAAALFDEDPVLAARLSGADSSGAPVILELPVPPNAAGEAPQVP